MILHHMIKNLASCDYYLTPGKQRRESTLELAPAWQQAGDLKQLLPCQWVQSRGNVCQKRPCRHVISKLILR